LASGQESLTDQEWRSAIALALLLVLAGVVILLLRLPRQELVTWFDALGNLGTFMLSMVAAAAALWWWHRRGAPQPRLRVNQSVTAIRDGLPAYTLLYVRARLENVGEIPIQLDKWCLWATRFLPLQEHVSGPLQEAPSHACRDYGLKWKALAGSEFEIESLHAPRIRPGEEQELAAILALPKDVYFIRLYSFFPHRLLNQLRTENRGWTKTAIVDLHQTGVVEEQTDA
jgi:hypothetical protein